MKTSRPNVLFIPLEFSNWFDASHWSYPTNFGFEEGFDALGITYTTLPAMHNGAEPLGGSSCYLQRAREICWGKTFDIVFIEVNHSHFSDDLLNWISTVAPIRIGLLPESISVDPHEFKTNSAGTLRRIANVERNLPYLTHVIAVDEDDVGRFKKEGRLKALWLSNSKIPRQFIANECPPPSAQAAIFYGALYGDRAEWLKRPDLQGLLVRPEASPEMLTSLPELYNQLHEAGKKALLSSNGSLEFLEHFLTSHRRIRRECYRIWIKALQDCSAVVNLPQYGRMFPSRVIEAMAAGRPVISWEIPDRPLTKALFNEGDDILFYPRTQPEKLVEHITRIQRDSTFAKQIAHNGWSKVRSMHTTECFTGELMHWLETGEEPSYCKLPAASSPTSMPETNLSINKQTLVNEIETTLGEKIHQGTPAVLNYLIPIATQYPNSLEECVRCLYSIFILQTMIATQRTVVLSQLLGHLELFGYEYELLQRIATANGITLAPSDTKLNSLDTIIMQLEVPDLLNAWRSVWLITICARNLAQNRVEKSTAHN